ncbi:MAG: ion channel [Actinomycetota bacterium]
MELIAILVGVFAVVSVTADMVNTLVTTSTNNSRLWLTSILYRRSWGVIRTIAHLFQSERHRESLLATYAPVSVLLLLVAWVSQQVIGFGLIWWGLGGLSGSEGLFESIYYSGVVYFTLGFGEVVPVAAVPRVGALVEALSGVLTTALVIGYLPSLYGAYSERERKLMTLDDGTEDRITPTNLIISRAPTGDVDELLRFFEGWEEWVAGVIETHTTFPMLRLFRSKHLGQNWVTAVGVLCDAALQCQMIVGARDKAPYWMLRRSVILFNTLTEGVDLSEYRARLDATYDSYDPESPHYDESPHFFENLYAMLESHGFELIDYETAREEVLPMRRLFDAQMEFLIDGLLAPRGFWGHQIGHEAASMFDREALPEATDGSPPSAASPAPDTGAGPERNEA